VSRIGPLPLQKSVLGNSYPRQLNNQISLAKIIYASVLLICWILVARRNYPDLPAIPLKQLRLTLTPRLHGAAFAPAENPSQSRATCKLS
jgi:hypothetical protein